jgi:hypothetical protein
MSDQNLNGEPDCCMFHRDAYAALLAAAKAVLAGEFGPSPHGDQNGPMVRVLRDDIETLRLAVEEAEK